ncbi:MAG: ABC transporter ATP-binding protein [Pirellulaceae bacterium]
MATAFIVTEELTKRYGDVSALRHCTLSVLRGEVFGLLGPNGAGKTTLLRLLMGFLHPTAGWARIDDLDCYRQSLAVRQRVAYLPGEACLFRQMRGRDALRFFADIRRRGNWHSSLQLAERLELDTSRRISSMSTGMRQKLALAVTLAAETPLVILDEPTSNLDPTVRGTVLELVREARARGQTIVFSSHVLSEVEQACDRVVILRAGELVHTQVMSELRRCHRIRAVVRGPVPAPPPQFQGDLVIDAERDGQVTIETPRELSSLFGWLSTLALEDVRIEPVGLRTVYDQFHTD